MHAEASEILPLSYETRLTRPAIAFLWHWWRSQLSNTRRRCLDGQHYAEEPLILTLGAEPDRYDES